uniref:Uncharacterized protein n=1 Tax=Avena sativa TaxID=4498 RepID=A0ACD5TRM4_AVESA
MAAKKYQILVAIICEVGSGQNVSLWSDRWIDGHSTSQIAPDLVQFIEPSKALQKTVAVALTVRNWIRDISGTLTIPSIGQFYELWVCIQVLPPLSEEQDKFTWRLTANGKYTAKSAY